MVQSIYSLQHANPASRPPKFWGWDRHDACQPYIISSVSESQGCLCRWTEYVFILVALKQFMKKMWIKIVKIEMWCSFLCNGAVHDGVSSTHACCSAHTVLYSHCSAITKEYYYSRNREQQSCCKSIMTQGGWMNTLTSRSWKSCICPFSSNSTFSNPVPYWHKPWHSIPNIINHATLYKVPHGYPYLSCDGAIWIHSRCVRTHTQDKEGVILDHHSMLGSLVCQKTAKEWMQFVGLQIQHESTLIIFMRLLYRWWCWHPDIGTTSLKLKLKLMKHYIDWNSSPISVVKII